MRAATACYPAPRVQQAAGALLLLLLACSSGAVMPARAQVHAAPAPAPQYRVSQLQGTQVTSNYCRVSGKVEVSLDGGRTWTAFVREFVVFSFTNDVGEGGAWRFCCTNDPALPCNTGCEGRDPSMGASVKAGGGAIRTDDNGLFATLLLQTKPGGGPTTVTIPLVLIAGGGQFTPSFIGPSSVTLGAPNPASAALAPHKVVAHVGDHVELFARLADSAGAAVRGAPVTFKAAGDCLPSIATAATKSDAAGLASVTIGSRKPGVVVVVAATRTAAGAVVVSPSSHIVFKEEPHHHAASSHGEEHTDYDHRYHRFAEEAAHLAAEEMDALPAR